MQKYTFFLIYANILAKYALKMDSIRKIIRSGAEEEGSASMKELHGKSV